MQPSWNLGCKKAETESTVRTIAHQEAKNRMLTSALSALGTTPEPRSRCLETHVYIYVLKRILPHPPSTST